jgi:hypothetical protein
LHLFQRVIAVTLFITVIRIMANRWSYFCIGSGGHGNGKAKAKSTNAQLETEQDIADCRSYFNGKHCPRKTPITFGGALNVVGLAGSASAVLDEITSFFERCKHNDEVPILYYTGHGDSDGSWCFPKGEISFDDIAQARKKAGCRMPAVLCDCCHSGEWVYRAKNSNDQWHIVAASGGSSQEKKLAYNRVFAKAVFKKDKAAQELLYSDSRAIATTNCHNREAVWFKGFGRSWLEP